MHPLLMVCVFRDDLCDCQSEYWCKHTMRMHSKHCADLSTCYCRFNTTTTEPSASAAVSSGHQTIE